MSLDIENIKRLFELIIEKAGQEFGKVNIESWGQQLDSIYKIRDYLSEWFMEALKPGSPEWKADIEKAIRTAVDTWQKEFVEGILGLGLPEKALVPKEAKDVGDKWRDMSMAFAAGIFIISVIVEVASGGQIDTIDRAYFVLDQSTGLSSVSAAVLQAQMYPAIITPLRQYWWSKYPTNIPSTSDLIDFVVKEAFPLEEQPDAPEQFVEYMQLQGFTELFCKGYWKIHWKYPSLTECYEAVHRGTRDVEWLKGMLILHDYEAKYHDVLIANMYKTLPRVDIRRAFEAGKFDYTEVYERMKIDGYSETDAHIQAETQIREVVDIYIKKEGKESEDDFGAGFIDEETLIADLEELGINPDIIKYRVSSAKKRFERKRKLKLIDLYCDGYQKDLVTEEALEAQLRELIVREEVIQEILQDEYVRKYRKPKA